MSWYIRGLCLLTNVDQRLHVGVFSSTTFQSLTVTSHRLWEKVLFTGKIPQGLSSHLGSRKSYFSHFSIWFRIGCSVCNFKWLLFEVRNLCPCALFIITLFICAYFVSIFLMLTRPPAVLPAVYRCVVQCCRILLNSWVDGVFKC